MSDVNSPITVEDLLVHQRWMRLLARDLTRDPSTADDLVQRTWVSALETPPQHHGAVRTWLRRVLRSHAREDARRRDVHRRHEERLPRRDVAPATDDLTARAEMQQRVIQAVLALDEPECRTVLLRFFEELPPREVAARLGEPVETVRSRLRRALARLRQRLDADCCGRAAWLAVLGPWGLGADPVTVPPSATTAALSATGGVLMGSVAKTGAVAIVLGLLVWWGWSEFDRERASPPSQQQVETAAPEDSAARRSRKRRARHTTDGTTTSVEANGDAAARTEVSVNETPWKLVFSGSVKGVRADDWKALRLAVQSESPRAQDADGLPAPRPIVFRVAADGTFQHDLSPLVVTRRETALVGELSHPNCFPTEFRIDITPSDLASDGPVQVRRELTLERAAIVRGRVLDENSAPLSQVGVAGVQLLDGAGTEKSAVRVLHQAFTNGDGYYRTRLRPGTGQAVVAVIAGRLPEMIRLRAPLDEETAAPPIVLGVGKTLSGDVRSVPGGPAADASVRLRVSEPGSRIRVGNRRLRLVGGRLFHNPATTATDADGRFSFSGLRPGERRMAVDPQGVSVDISNALHRDVVVPSSDVQVRFSAVQLRLTISSDGQPLKSVPVHLYSSTGITVIETNDRGVASTYVQPGARLTARVRVAGFETADRAFSVPVDVEEHNASIEVPREIERPELLVRVDGDQALAGAPAGLCLYAPGAKTWSPTHHRNAELAGNGRLRFSRLPPGRWKALLRIGGEWCGGSGFVEPVELDLDLPLLGTVETTATPKVAGRLRIRARDARGDDLPAFCKVRNSDGVQMDVYFVRLSPDGFAFGPSALGGNGPAMVEPALPAGTYRVELSHRDHRSQTIEVKVQNGRIADVDVRLDAK